MRKIIRSALFALFIIFSLYAPGELIRYILAFEKFYGFFPGFDFEIIFIVACYIVDIVLFILILTTNVEDKQ